jgi:UDP-N-acetylmuramoylalanine--D-glutamate ligase
MNNLQHMRVLVIGLGDRGRAACALLAGRGAEVSAVDIADTPGLRSSTASLAQQGIRVRLGVRQIPPQPFDLAVVSPVVHRGDPLLQEVASRGIRLISELELGFEMARCLAIAVAGTNGKSTTAALIQHMLSASGRKTLLAGDRRRPLCAFMEETRELDYLVLQVNAFQLEQTENFRPVVAVLTSLAPDHLDRYATEAQYVKAHAGLFGKQQAFDWAVVQSNALKQLGAAGIQPPSKLITFSASDASADLFVDRGLLISRIPGWDGPLLDMDHCRLQGPHNAENILAALAVGRILRVPLEVMVESIKAFPVLPHRMELVAEIQGVRYVNDSKATNLDALHNALLTVSPTPGGGPNVWLIAGGRDKGLEYHDIGPLLSKHVKHAFLVGESQEKLRAAWSLFTPCTLMDSLVEAVHQAARNAVSGDVILLSPACSSFDQFQNYQNRGETFCEAVKSIDRGAQSENPNIDGKNKISDQRPDGAAEKR